MMKRKVSEGENQCLLGSTIFLLGGGGGGRGYEETHQRPYSENLGFDSKCDLRVIRMRNRIATYSTSTFDV